jgi:hypothetical protein
LGGNGDVESLTGLGRQIADLTGRDLGVLCPDGSLDV